MAVSVNHDKCMACAGCVGVCPKSALDYINRRIEVDSKACVNCGLCVKFCPAGALSLKVRK